MKKFMMFLLFVVGIFLLYNPMISAPNVTNRTEIEHWAAKERQYLRQQEFDRFLKDLGYRESNNNWRVYNSFGYIGEWQLGRLALIDIGYSHITYYKFKKDPNIFPRSEQKKAVIALVNLNIKYLGSVIDDYEGKIIKNIEVTKSGLVAASHLAGARGVKVFLVSNGRINPTDANGTSVATYLKLFKGYKI